MRVTPLDLRQTEFRLSLRGFNREEVRAFLLDAANDYEQALRELGKAQDQLRQAQQDIAEHREREVALCNTLLTAQRLADQIRENAEQEGKMVVSEAAGRADLLLQKTQLRLEEMERDVQDLKTRRRDVEHSLETSIATLSAALHAVRARDQKEKEERLLIHRPRVAAEIPAQVQGMRPADEPGAAAPGIRTGTDD
jgi:cell division initiation protein